MHSYMEKVFIVRWFGPFQFDQVRDWEILQKNTFNLYLIGGKKKNSKNKIHYYIGKAERALLSDRLHDEGDPKVNQIFKEITDCKFKE